MWLSEVSPRISESSLLIHFTELVRLCTGQDSDRARSGWDGAGSLPVLRLQGESVVTEGRLHVR